MARTVTATLALLALLLALIVPTITARQAGDAEWLDRKISHDLDWHPRYLGGNH